VLVAAPAAAADVRYAEPLGDGPSATCPQTNPCEIHDATTAAASGDTVIVLPGTYALGTDTVSVADITIEGQPGAERPRLLAGAASPLAPSAGATVRRLHLASNDLAGGRVVDVLGTAVVEQSVISAHGSTMAAVQVRNGGTLRDSVAVSESPFGMAVIVGGSGGTLRNVTAVATGTDSSGVWVPAAYTLGDDVSRAGLTNVIAQGAAADILAEGDGDATPDDIEVTVANSNFDTVSEDEPGADVIPGAGNQTAAPRFANVAGLDFRQLPGSPTIDAGTGVGVSVLDFEGGARVQGPAPDMGADEAPDPSSLLALRNAKLKAQAVIRVPIACPAYACNVAAAATIVTKGGKRKKGRAAASNVVRLRNSSASLAAGGQGFLVFRLSKKQRSGIRGKATLNVSASVSGPLGFSGAESRRYALKAAKKRRRKGGKT
jgi:hypothetical protein